MFYKHISSCFFFFFIFYLAGDGEHGVVILPYNFVILRLNRGGSRIIWGGRVLRKCPVYYVTGVSN